MQATSTREMMGERPYYLKKKGPRVGAAMVVIRLRKGNPCMTLKQIGDRVGVTRERVRQVLSRAGLPTRALVSPKLRYECPGCGKLLLGPMFFCAFCESRVLWTERAQKARVRRGLKHVFCSLKCLSKSRRRVK